MTHCSSKMQRAWQVYLEGIESIRSMIYHHPFAAYRDGAHRAHYLVHQIQAAAFNVAFGPRQHSPRFFSNLLFDPAIYTWTSPSADYVYRKAFVDGARTYRVWGNRSNVSLMTLQVMGAYWGDPEEDMAHLGNYEIDEFVKDTDGSFEFIASPTRHEGNWVRLDPKKRNIVLMVREVYRDWECEVPGSIHIEQLDSPDSVLSFTEDEFIARMESAVRFMRYTVSTYSGTVIAGALQRGGYNSITDPEMHLTLSHSGVNPIGGFYTGCYSIESDDAWIIELGHLKAKHWLLQHCDLWHQAVNFVDHQSSLNGHQARQDEDGTVRIVLALQDPGVANWLDPVGLGMGGVDLRFLYPESSPEIRTRVVKLSELRKALPASTVYVSPQERQRIVNTRRRAALTRWGH